MKSIVFLLLENLLFSPFDKQAETMKTLFTTLFLLAVAVIGFSQNEKTQTVSGQIIDKTTKQPLVGATVILLGSNPVLGTTSDIDGKFIFSNVPIGRQSFETSFIGYGTYVESGVVVTSSNSIEINIELEPSQVLSDEVVVKARKFSNDPVNEFSTVSTRSFSGEETNLFAAAINDPGRVALSFPGVQQGNFDTENDVIIRGNSSVGMLWRLEGIDILTPNHFARTGSSGGGVTIFSSEIIGRSDFSTGGMAAEYGNAISGAMDIHFRKGNKKEFGYKARLNLIGADLAAEGPIQKDRSSFLVNYRYSTLGLMTQLGFPVLGERVVNTFQDLSFNLSFDSKDRKTLTTIFGLGGLSFENNQPVANPLERDIFDNEHWEDRQRGSDMAAVGITVTKLLTEKSWLKFVVAGMANDIWRENDTLSLEDERFRYETEDFRDRRIALAGSYVYQLSNNLRFKTGFQAHQINYTFFKEELPRSNVIDPFRQIEVNANGEGNTQLLQGYFQTKYQFNPKFEMNAGLNLMYLTLNQNASLDPRLSFKYNLSQNQELGLAYSIQSQHAPLALHNFSSESGQLTNLDLDFMQAQHFVLSYKNSLGKSLRLQVEPYFQLLNNIPVTPDLNDNLYWFLNDKVGFTSRELVSEGKGRNYGVDVALEKFFSGDFFLLATGSIFENEYAPLNGEYFSSRYNTGWVSSLSFGKEWTFRSGNTFLLGGRSLYNGGFRFTPFDAAASELARAYVPDTTQPWADQVDPYFRIDTRTAYRFNFSNSSLLLSLDIQNLTNHDNPRGIRYLAESNTLDFRNHPSGFLPLLGIEFEW